MIRTAALLVGGNAFTSAVLLVRNLVVARLISVEDYGVASTFAITMAVVEMASNLGLQQLVVQDRAGNDPRLQAGLQGFNALRGLASGAVMLALAGPLAAFLGVPEVAWAYQLMALVPVMRGLHHFDVERFKRHMRFGPWVVAGLVPAVLSVAVVWPLDRLFGDWRVMLWSVLGQVALSLLASHLLAERRFALSLDRRVMAKGLRFGWPLLLNGVLLFLVMHGEKLVVGRELGMAPLGILAMGLTLTLTPTLVLARSAQAFFLPQLSAVQEDDARFGPLAAATLQAAVANGLAVAVAIAALGPFFVLGVLGDKYAALVPLLTPLAILQAVRVFKAGPAVVALARGRTGNAALGNLPRVASIAVAWWALAQGAGLMAVVVIAISGEVVGCAVALALLRARARVALAPMIPTALAATLVLGALAAEALWLGAAHAGAQALGLAGCVALLAASLWAMRELRGYLLARALTRFEGEDAGRGRA